LITEAALGPAAQSHRRDGVLELIAIEQDGESTNSPLVITAKAVSARSESEGIPKGGVF